MKRPKVKLTAPGVVSVTIPEQMFEAEVPAEELLAMAIAFDMGPEPILNGLPFWWDKWPREAKLHRISVKNMSNPGDGPDRWGIFSWRSDLCLNKNGRWEYQPMGSSRTEKFYERCRYDSLHDAIMYYRRWRAAVEEWAKKKMAKAKGEINLSYEDIPAKLLKY